MLCGIALGKREHFYYSDSQFIVCFSSLRRVNKLFTTNNTFNWAVLFSWSGTWGAPLPQPSVSTNPISLSSDQCQNILWWVLLAVLKVARIHVCSVQYRKHAMLFLRVALINIHHSHPSWQILLPSSGGFYSCLVSWMDLCSLLGLNWLTASCSLKLVRWHLCFSHMMILSGGKKSSCFSAAIRGSFCVFCCRWLLICQQKQKHIIYENTINLPWARKHLVSLVTNHPKKVYRDGQYDGDRLALIYVHSVVYKEQQAKPNGLWQQTFYKFSLMLFCVHLSKVTHILAPNQNSSLPTLD